MSQGKRRIKRMDFVKLGEQVLGLDKLEVEYIEGIGTDEIGSEGLV